jgi:hypothetical protein
MVEVGHGHKGGVILGLTVMSDYIPYSGLGGRRNKENTSDAAEIPRLS